MIKNTIQFTAMAGITTNPNNPAKAAEGDAKPGIDAPRIKSATDKKIVPDRIVNMPAIIVVTIMFPVNFLNTITRA